MSVATITDSCNLVAVGAIVKYHGSIVECHGQYRITDNTKGRYSLHAYKRDATDIPQIDIEPTELQDVRRESFTPTGDTYTACDA